MEYDVKHICITGPESTGKSTLSAHLARKYKTTYVEEYARTYLKNNTKYKYDDLLAIALGQHQLLTCAKEANRLIISDTDLLTIIIWSKVVFGKVDIEIHRLWREHLPQKYLLCKPDIPWEYDPLRENPNDRERLFEIYLKFVLDSGVDFDVITGSRSEYTDNFSVDV